MKQVILKLKKEILNLSILSKEGHIPSSFSILDLLWVLYNKILNIDPKNPNQIDRDFFILSKGHASLAIYIVLAEKGFFPKEALSLFGKYNSLFGGHPDRNKISGIEASTGSLGHGMPIAVGIALSCKINNYKNKIITLIGDGEANEGSIWEAFLLASQHQLSNLVCIIDHNHSTDRALNLENLKGKLMSFGWQVIEIDGHAHTEIENSLKTSTKNSPLAIIAHTVKGHGSKILENNPAWHHRTPTPEEYELIIKELEELK